MKITIYQKPTCSTCRAVVKELKESGADFEAVNYYTNRFTKTELAVLLKKAGLKSRDILRTKEEIYKKLGLAKKEISDDELLEIMLKHPDLIQRPLAVKGKRVIMARPPERIREFLI